MEDKISNHKGMKGIKGIGWRQPYHIFHSYVV